MLRQILDFVQGGKEGQKKEEAMLALCNVVVEEDQVAVLHERLNCMQEQLEKQSEEVQQLRYELKCTKMQLIHQEKENDSALVQRKKRRKNS